jgi:hypothetical protein
MPNEARKTGANLCEECLLPARMIASGINQSSELAEIA